MAIFFTMDSISTRGVSVIERNREDGEVLYQGRGEKGGLRQHRVMINALQIHFSASWNACFMTF